MSDGRSPELVHHLAHADVWAEARDRGAPYPWSTVDQRLDDVGYVHCAFAHQVAGVVARHYVGRTDDLLVLSIDPSRAGAELVVEDTSGRGERFPHLYGPLTPEAVVAEEPLEAFLERQPQGGGTEGASS